MFKKRGQVSIYILIGVVIIIVVGLSFYIVGNTILKESGRDLDIRPELIPAKNFIDSCILDVAREGVDLIGLQGGNVNIEEEVIVNPLVKFGNSLDLFGNGALNVNYWFYRTPNGINTLSVPSEQDMEREIGEYIMRNIASCYEDLALFDQYDVSYSSTSKINVDIKEDRVLINVESPLEITSGGITSNLNKFSVVLDTKLGKLYSLGRGILEKENEKLFFEERVWQCNYIIDFYYCFIFRSYPDQKTKRGFIRPVLFRVNLRGREWCIIKSHRSQRCRKGNKYSDVIGIGGSKRDFGGS